MKILVTGATGFIGSHIIEELAKQGLSLRAAYRPGDNFRLIDSDFLIDGLDLESFPLDLTDARATREATQGCQILFHADSIFSFSKKDKERLYAINHVGTRNLMEAALANGVEKVVYTSGMETLMAPPGQKLIRETDGVSLDDLSTHFERSRYLAEREVLRLKHHGLPVIIVHPTICVGSRDRGTSPFGRYLQRYLQHKTRFYLNTGFNLVDVVDVAKAHLLAAKRGEVGARYILGNQNVSVLEIFRYIEKLTGIPVPKTALPPFIAKLGNTLFRYLLLQKEAAPPSIITRLKQPFFFDTSFSREKLGMPQSNVWEALKREIQDLLKK